MSPNHRQEPRETIRGITLVELVQALVLIGILMAIAAPMIDVGKVRVNGAAAEVSTRLMACQRLAVLEQHDVRVSFDLEEESLFIHRDRNNDGTVDSGERVTADEVKEGVVFGLGGAPGIRNPARAVTFSDGPDGNPLLVFHRNGSVSEEGFVYLSPLPGDKAENTRALSLVRATGTVRCWSYRTGSWEEGC